MPIKETFKTHEEYIQWYRIYRNKNRNKIRDYNREYNDRYRKEHQYSYELKYIKENKEKMSAQCRARRAYPIAKQCEVCSNKGIRHHPNYSYPLYIIWLCQKHHRWIHQIFTTDELKDITKEEHIFILDSMEINNI